MKSITYLSLILLFSSCAGIKFYDDKDSKNEIGLKYYQQKPFLLVEYNPSKDVKVKSTIIYLPDLQNPDYVKQKRGFGSSDLKMELENGMLKSFGSTYDSKVPETVTGVGSLATGIGGIATGIGGIMTAIDSDDAGSDSDESFDAGSDQNVDKALSIIRNVITDLKTVKPISTNDTKLLKTQISNLEKTITNLSVKDSKTYAKNAKALDQISKMLEKLKTSNQESIINVQISKSISEINTASKLLVPVKKEASTWVLYEFNYNKTTKQYEFNEVNFN